MQTTNIARVSPSLVVPCIAYRTHRPNIGRSRSTATTPLPIPPMPIPIATFAMGWFWGPQKIFDSLEGVVGTRVGYTGGSNPSPTYDSVCAGDGHAEAIQIEYDPTKVTYEELLDHFWANVGIGVGQYRPVIWHHDDEQRVAAEASALAAGISSDLVAKVPTRWHNAEDYHQKYYERHKKSSFWFLFFLPALPLWCLHSSLSHTDPYVKDIQEASRPITINQ